MTAPSPDEAEMVEKVARGLARAQIKHNLRFDDRKEDEAFAQRIEDACWNSKQFTVPAAVVLRYVDLPAKLAEARRKGMEEEREAIAALVLEQHRAVIATWCLDDLGRLRIGNFTRDLGNAIRARTLAEKDAG